MQELFTPQELADMLRVHRQVIYHWCRDGTIKAIKLPNRWNWRITLEEVNRIREEMGLEPL